MRNNSIGYSYWGFLGDDKYNILGDKISTPDGNAFYSWSIIKGFQAAGYEVIQVMPDRDYPGFKLRNSELFRSWCCSDRYLAYAHMSKSEDWMYLDYQEHANEYTSNMVWDIWRKLGLCDCKFILHEWRMEVPGRNELRLKGVIPAWQPDLWLQEELISFCRTYDITLVVFDLDYKLEVQKLYEMLDSGVDVRVIELGMKWDAIGSIKSSQVEIPFDFGRIDNFNVIDTRYCDKDLVYVGNRYERDWCVDKYIPHRRGKTTFYGNWLEANRRSNEDWPYITFKPRAQLTDMHEIYSHSVATILMAKQDYCDNGFMTARIIECIFYGSLPIFIEEFGEKTIHKYAGGMASELTAHSVRDVNAIVRKYKHATRSRELAIMYLRKYLSFMDVKNFVSEVERLSGWMK